MNWQQWKSVKDCPPPLGRWVAVTPGGYVMRGKFELYTVNGEAHVLAGASLNKKQAIGCYDWKGHLHKDIAHWSWSETEPEPEMLMVKPHGIFCAHWWNEIGCLLNIIHDFEVDTFIEIGLLDGGLTSIMLDQVRWGSSMGGIHYLGVDLHLCNVNTGVLAEAFKYSWAELMEGDCHDPLVVKQVVAKTLSMHQTISGGRRFFYCDGGDKALEAHLFWPYLLPGDLLGLHDYSDDPLAKGPEVFPKDVQDLLAAGKRHGREALADTRILLLEKT